MKGNRRAFIKKVTKTAGVSTAAMMLPASWNQTVYAANQEKKEEVLPTPAQKAWMDLGFGMFVHFGINTYYDREWSDGTLDPSSFNPTNLDTDQWCRVAKAAGMKYIIPVCKHHDGFCLWDTKYTDYSVNATPFKKDVLAELANSAQKHGLKLGVYYSLWDRNNLLHDTNEPAYVDWMKQQLEELLTNYGEITELWFDGFWKKQQHGWTKKITDESGENIAKDTAIDRDDKFIKAWRAEGAYRWQMDHVYQFVKSIQPNCLVMNNPTTAYQGVPLHPVDIRSGEKYTNVKNDRKVWNWLGKDNYLPLQVETTLSASGNKKFPSGNWFWHENDKSVKSKETILDYLATTKKMQANLLLNAGPSAAGKLREEDERVLLSLQD